MFDHYVALDWAKSNMAIAKMTNKSDKIKVIDVPSDIKELILYLKKLKGNISLTFEETNTSQWLYTELKNYVEKILICDPVRNRLLSEGAKTDKQDAAKLVRLLKANLLKEIYHNNDEFIKLRKIVSSYNDLIQAGVRSKNQRSAIFRSINKDHKKDKKLDDYYDNFVLQGLDEGIENYENERERYKKEFSKICKKNKLIKYISEVPGIGEISAVKIVSRVVDANRFETRNMFLAYCGLIKIDRKSGNKIYGRKNPRYCRMMKYVFKVATASVIYRSNPFNDYYEYLINEKKCANFNARNATSRKIATVIYGILKSGLKYNPKLFKYYGVNKNANL